ncbi:MAG: sulfotransferase, partial [Saprospiraceae bacterium]|nr:sulfotransferase [Saprospiraceae bacterium]
LYIRFTGPKKIKLSWKNTYDQLLRKTAFISGKQKIISKNPVNTGRIQVLLEMYPDAKFIFIYRNPDSVFRSTKKFYQILFEILSFQNYDLKKQEQLILDLYKNIMKDYLAQRENIPKGQLAEVRFEEFINDPLNTIKDIYEQLSLGQYENVKPYFKDHLSDIEKKGTNNQHSIAVNESKIIRKEWAFAFKEWSY